jgi:hypothetical protein
MTATEREVPFVWVTWLTKLMAGEDSCRWSSWFKAHHKYDKLPSDFNLTQWTAEHSQLVHRRANELEAQGCGVFIEDENQFYLTGRDGITTLSGKPDIVAVRGDEVLVEDCKTGKPRNSDKMQVLIYMLVLKLVKPDLAKKTFHGSVFYKDHPQIEIEPDAVNSDFLGVFQEVMEAVKGADPCRKVPSYRECKFCDIGPSDCAERVDEEPLAVAATEHDLF